VSWTNKCYDDKVVVHVEILEFADDNIITSVSHGQFSPLTPTVAIWVQLPWVSECPDVKNYKWRLNPVWHRMLCSL